MWCVGYMYVSCLFQYYAECHGVIYVIDSTDEGRLSESKEAFGEFSACVCIRAVNTPLKSDSKFECFLC